MPYSSSSEIIKSLIPEMRMSEACATVESTMEVEGGGGV